MERLEEQLTKQFRILIKLCGARRTDTWISVKELMKYGAENTIRTVLRRLLDKKLIERQKVPSVKGRWHYAYRATEAGLAVQELGGLPTPPLKDATTTKVLEVALRNIDEILDTTAIDWEVLQYTIRVDGYSEGKMRGVCNPPKKGSRDRAKQVSYSEAEFAMTVAKGGKCSVSLKGHKWEPALRMWLGSSGLSKAAIQNILSQIKNQLPFGKARFEIPVLEQALEEMNVRCNVRTEVRGEFVESNINYSLGKIGIEYFGDYRWVETLVQILVALQHTTVVSEVRRDQFIADMMALLEEQRLEREAKEEAEEKKEDGKTPDYII